MSEYAPLIIGIIVAILFLVALYFGKRIYYIRDELDYINMEISRTTGRERIFWQYEKKRLWLSLIPFYRGK